jgi:hypothetical protein
MTGRYAWLWAGAAAGACVLGSSCRIDPSLQRAEQELSASDDSTAASSVDSQQGLIAIGGGTRTYGAGDPWPDRLATGGRYLLYALIVVLLYVRVMRAVKDARIKGYHEQRLKRLEEERDRARTSQGIENCPGCGRPRHHGARRARHAQADRGRLHGRVRERAARGQPARRRTGR